jgi:hypothetical protein
MSHEERKGGREGREHPSFCEFFVQQRRKVLFSTTNYP